MHARIGSSAAAARNPADAGHLANVDAVGAEIRVVRVAGQAQQREVLIHAAVAVVVDPVADLEDVLRSLVHTLVSARRAAGEGAVLALVEVVAVARLPDREVLIDAAVTVVVEAVADLHDVGGHIVHAHDRLVHRAVVRVSADGWRIGVALEVAVRALVRVGAVAGIADREVLVHVAIAVVVQAVALLGVALVVAKVRLEVVLLRGQLDLTRLGRGRQHELAGGERALVHFHHVAARRQAVEQVPARRISGLGAHQRLVHSVPVSIHEQVNHDAIESGLVHVERAALVRIQPHGVADAAELVVAEVETSRLVGHHHLGLGNWGRVDPAGLQRLPHLVSAHRHAVFHDVARGIGQAVEHGAERILEADLPVRDARLARVCDAVGIEVPELEELERAGGLGDIERHGPLGLPRLPAFQREVLDADLIAAQHRPRRCGPGACADDGGRLRPERGLVHVRARVPGRRRHRRPPDEIVEHALLQVVVRVQDELRVVVGSALELDRPVVALHAEAIVDDGLGRSRRTPYSDAQCESRLEVHEHQSCKHSTKTQTIAVARRLHGISSVVSRQSAHGIKLPRVVPNPIVTA